MSDGGSPGQELRLPQDGTSDRHFEGRKGVDERDQAKDTIANEAVWSNGPKSRATAEPESADLSLGNFREFGHVSLVSKQYLQGISWSVLKWE
jgi:hypothetical protein